MSDNLQDDNGYTNDRTKNNEFSSAFFVKKSCFNGVAQNVDILPKVSKMYQLYLIEKTKNRNKSEKLGCNFTPCLLILNSIFYSYYNIT